MIPYGRQDISQDDIDAVVEVLTSDFLTQGPKVPEFESKVSEYCGAKHGVAVNSATSALHIACLALDIGPGDIVWTSPISFVASANCVLYCGGTVDFVDINPDTFNMSADELRSKLEAAEKLDKLPKAVIPVHMAGQSCDMAAIYDLSQQYGFKIIEDASHAIGGSYKDSKVGSCKYSDMTVFSFHPVKIITSAEGGMVMTNDSKLSEKLRLNRSHGITRDPELMTREPHGPWYYEQVSLGYNYRMSDMQAALGISQMDRLDDFVSRRTELSELYNKGLQHLPIQIPMTLNQCQSSWHLYIIRIPDSAKNMSRQKVFQEFQNNNLNVNVHYIPITQQPYYRNVLSNIENLENADRYYESAITLPLYPELIAGEYKKIIQITDNIITSML